MDWASLTKEQKQIIVLVAIVAVAGLYALVQFVLAPFASMWAEAGEELRDLQGRLRSASALIVERPRIEEDLERSVVEVRTAMRDYVAPLDNSLSWVTERIYRHAREAGLEVEAISEMASVTFPKDQADKTERVFKPYPVRISAQGAYAQVAQMLRNLEASNPYLCVTDITITGQDQDIRRHDVAVVVEWPLWADSLHVATVRNNLEDLDHEE